MHRLLSPRKKYLTLRELIVKAFYDNLASFFLFCAGCEIFVFLFDCVMERTVRECKTSLARDY